MIDKLGHIVTVHLPAAHLDALDEARGSLTRSVALRRILAEVLDLSNPLPRVPHSTYRPPTVAGRRSLYTLLLSAEARDRARWSADHCGLVPDHGDQVPVSQYLRHLIDRDYRRLRRKYPPTA